MSSDIYVGDCRDILPTMPEKSVDCVITSPPYFQLRDYGSDKQIGAEKTWQEYVANLQSVFHEVKRVLKDNGTLWLNIGDKYSGSHNCAHGDDKKWVGRNPQNKLITDWSSCDIPERNLMGLPWRVAFALQSDGWVLRQDIIWHKPNAMPGGGSNPNKCTPSHEYLFLFTKIPKGYTWNLEAMLEPCANQPPKIRDNDKGGKYAEHQESTYKNGRHNRYCTYWPPIGGIKAPGNAPNKTYSDGIREAKPMRRKRDVWSIPTQPYSGAHFACFPEALCRPCIAAGSPAGGVVMDCFCGSGTVGKVSLELGRTFVGVELNPDYVTLAEQRINTAKVKL